MIWSNDNDAIPFSSIKIKPLKLKGFHTFSMVEEGVCCFFGGKGFAFPVTSGEAGYQLGVSHIWLAIKWWQVVNLGLQPNHVDNHVDKWLTVSYQDGKNDKNGVGVGQNHAAVVAWLIDFLSCLVKQLRLQKDLTICDGNHLSAMNCLQQECPGKRDD